MDMQAELISSEDRVVTENDHAQISQAVRILNAGGTVAFPTETVYGLGADATNIAAVRKIYQIKQRPENHPLILHIADAAYLQNWVQDVPEAAWKLAEKYWPGPLTLILKRNQRVSDVVTGGQNTVGIRVPSHSMALSLLREMGRDKALAAPSANRFGRISPTTAAHVQKDLGATVDMILDGGACIIGLESTIVSFVGEHPKVLRPGGIPLTELESALGHAISVTGSMNRANTPTIRVSGSLASHYAPTTPLQLCATADLWQQAQNLANQQLKTMVITWSKHQRSFQQHPYLQHTVMPNDAEAYGRQLYAMLHQTDQAGFGYLLVETVPDDSSWQAVQDRLQRASHQPS